MRTRLTSLLIAVAIIPLATPVVAQQGKQFDATRTLEISLNFRSIEVFLEETKNVNDPEALRKVFLARLNIDKPTGFTKIIHERLPDLQSVYNRRNEPWKPSLEYPGSGENTECKKAWYDKVEFYLQNQIVPPTQFGNITYYNVPNVGKRTWKGKIHLCSWFTNKDRESYTEYYFETEVAMKELDRREFMDPSSPWSNLSIPAVWTVKLTASKSDVKVRKAIEEIPLSPVISNSFTQDFTVGRARNPSFHRKSLAMNWAPG